MNRVKVSRREFLATSLLTASASLLAPVRSFGRQAPGSRITVGMIGMGRQALQVNLPPLLMMPEVQVVAVCDVDEWRLVKAKADVDKFYGNTDCAVYRDWQEVVAHEDIDAIINSTPDHWHVPISLAAVRAGKHVCCEKPLTLSVAEGRVLADAVKEKGVVFRTDTECRSHVDMHRIAGLARNGYLGKITHLEVGVPEADGPGGNPEAMPIPSELDYDMWLGPAPNKPYTLDRVHPPESLGRPGWMRCRDTCEGVVTNWGTHMLDVAQLILDKERTGPVAVEATGTFPEPGSGLWDVLYQFEARFRYADGVTLRYHTDSLGAYIKVVGDEGWIHGDWHRRGPGQVASNPAVFEVKLNENDLRIPMRQDKEDFINAIVNNEPTMIDAEIGHRTCSMGQIAHIAVQRGKPLDWNPDTERFTNDEDANALLTRPVRGTWMEE